jgi:hypothetical protein
VESGREATPGSRITKDEIVQRLREDAARAAHQQMDDYPPEGAAAHSEAGVFGGWMRRLFSRG